ncbi:hypothetical protein [Acetobacter conturbans]|nr:hypothetical protein [Acetobacter conturbans]
MASCRPKTEVPVVTTRILIVSHICLAVFIVGMAWLDWSLPS